MTAVATKDRTTTPTAADYRRLIVDARKQQLRATAENVQRLRGIYERAAQNVAAQLVNVPAHMLTAEGALQQAYLRTLLFNIGKVLDDLKTDYADLLSVSLLDSAQMTADREARVAELMTAAPASDERLLAQFNRTATLSDGTSLSVQFGTVARQAVEATATRMFRDGLRLSDRLYRLDAAGRKVVEDTILQGLAEGTSAKKLAGRLQEQLAAAGAENPRYQAMRIARTEINNAHREAHIRSVMTPEGATKPYVVGVRWNLSLSGHKQADICDVYAAHDEGLGPGVYQPMTVPTEHPHGLCVTTSVMRAYPEVGLPQRKPDIAAVPPAQIAYYAEHGDVPAAALQQAQATAAAQGATQAASAHLQGTIRKLVAFAQGRPGRPGDEGIRGPKGRDGRPGEQGQIGPAGRDGKNGEVGPVGPPGHDGKDGRDGQPGQRGERGPIGPAGRDGEAGAAGAKGDRGERGAKGEKGDKGDRGERGLPGRDGERGPIGEPGRDGVAGAPGRDGAKGADGINGANGAKGADGAEGKAGEQGPPGEPGLNWRGPWSRYADYAVGDAVQYEGSSYVATQANTNNSPPSFAWDLLAKRGDKGAMGEKGERGAPGPGGWSGPTGPAGPAGPQGPPGVGGGLANTIQLLAADPVAPTDGEIWFNTTTRTWNVCLGDTF